MIQSDTRPRSRPGRCYSSSTPPTPVLPAGVATNSTVVLARLCSPKTEAVASVSDAMSRRISSSASGRANIASRTPSVTAGEPVLTSSAPDRPAPDRYPDELHGDELTGPLAVHRRNRVGQRLGQGRFPSGEVIFERMDGQVGHAVLLR